MVTNGVNSLEGSSVGPVIAKLQFVLQTLSPSVVSDFSIVKNKTIDLSLPFEEIGELSLNSEGKAVVSAYFVVRSLSGS